VAKIQLTRLTQTSAARHTTTLKPFGNDEEMRIVYRGMSLIESDAFTKKFEGMPATEALPKALAEQVIELPDVFNADKQVEPTEEFFASLDTYVLHRIANAIQNDRSGNPI
jgi:hypothetical protein